MPEAEEAEPQHLLAARVLGAVGRALGAVGRALLEEATGTAMAVVTATAAVATALKDSTLPRPSAETATPHCPLCR